MGCSHDAPMPIPPLPTPPPIAMRMAMRMASELSARTSAARTAMAQIRVERVSCTPVPPPAATAKLSCCCSAGAAAAAAVPLLPELLRSQLAADCAALDDVTETTAAHGKLAFSASASHQPSHPAATAALPRTAAAADTAPALPLPLMRSQLRLPCGCVIVHDPAMAAVIDACIGVGLISGLPCASTPVQRPASAADADPDAADSGMA